MATFTATISDTLSLSGAVAVLADTHVLAVSNTLALSDSLLVEKPLERTISDSIVLTDQVLREPADVYTGVSLFRTKAGQSQLRVEPTNATPSDPVGNVGTITVVAGSALADGDSFVLNDLHFPVTFEFDDDASVTETGALKPIVFTGSETADQVRDLVIAAINAASLTTRMSATSGGSALVDVDNLSPVAAGKGTITESVVDAGFLIALDAADGTHVMCLGSDLEFPAVEQYAIGDAVSVKQTITLEASTKLVKIQGRYRQPASMPVRTTVTGTVKVQRSQRRAIVVPVSALLVDGETVTVNDGVNPLVTFEFDNNASVVETATLRAVVFDGTETETELRDLLLAAINAAPTLDVLASAAGFNRVALVNTVGGTLTVLDTVTDPGLVIQTSFTDVTYLTTTSAFFAAADVLKVLHLEGAGIVNGDYRIGQFVTSQKVMLQDSPLAAPSAPSTLTVAYVIGAHWKLDVLLEGLVIFDFEPGRDGGVKRDLLMPDIAIHASKFSGAVDIEYRMILAETT